MLKDKESKFMIELGLLISELRSDKDITRMEFSKLTGLNRQHLFYIEIGKRPTTINTLFIITEVLEVGLSDFFVLLKERMNNNECL